MTMFISRESLTATFTFKFFYHRRSLIWSLEQDWGKRLKVSLLSAVNYAAQAHDYYTTEGT